MKVTLKSKCVAAAQIPYYESKLEEKNAYCLGCIHCQCSTTVTVSASITNTN